MHPHSLPLVLLITIVPSCVYADVIVYALRWEGVVAEFRDLPARFGDDVPSEGLKGKLVLAEPRDACSPIAPPVYDPSDDFPGVWMVLIKRGQCTFEVKARNAQRANYSALIVHNVNSSFLEIMTANNPGGIHITSVFVSDEAGAFLGSKHLYEQGFYVIITDDTPFNISTTLLMPFAIIVGLCFLIMVGIMTYRCIRNRRRERRHRLPPSSLRKIPTEKFSKGDPYETCAICLEDYLEGDKLRILPCSHAYHSKCIDPWLTRNRRVCPVCKRRVFAHDEHISETESDTDTDDTTPLLRQPSNVTQGGTFTTASTDTREGDTPSGSADIGERRTTTADLSRSAPTPSLPRAMERQHKRRRQLFHSVQAVEGLPQIHQQQQDSESVTSEYSSTSSETSSDYWDSLYASAEVQEKIHPQGELPIPGFLGEHSINGDTQAGNSEDNGNHDVVV